jgi:rfaE bifunctional protein nucleotidyltransferase chain/domain
MTKVWTNGCFDILHIGHIDLLKYAKGLGDHLTVGIDSDLRVKSLKGYDRPINNESDRKLFLESIKYIDEVVIFNDEQNLVNTIKNSNIDIIVVGDDYKNKRVIGSDIAKVIFFKKNPDKSTSNLIKYYYA